MRGIGRAARQLMEVALPSTGGLTPESFNDTNGQFSTTLFMAKVAGVRDRAVMSESKRQSLLASLTKVAAVLPKASKVALIDAGFGQDACLTALIDLIDENRDTSLHGQALRLVAALCLPSYACAWTASVPLMEEVETSLQSNKPTIRVSALELVSAIARERRSRGVLILSVRKLLPSCLQEDPQLLEGTLCTMELLVDTDAEYQNKLATPTLERLADLLLHVRELPSDKAKNALFNTHLTFARNELVAGIMFQLKVLKRLVDTLNRSKEQSLRFRSAEIIVALTQHEQYAALVDPELHRSIFTIFSLDNQVIAQKIASDALLLVLRRPEQAKLMAQDISELGISSVATWISSPVFDIRLNGLAVAAILAPYAVTLIGKEEVEKAHRQRLRDLFVSILAPLTEVMKGICEEEQTLAMSVVKSLSASSDLQSEIVEHGVLEIILGSVSSQDGCIRLNALETLHNIATEDQHQSRLARSSMVIAKLLVVTRDQEELPLTLHALRTLLHLAKYEEHQLKIVEAGVVEPIIAMALQNLPQNETNELLTAFVESPHVNVQWSVAIALHALSKVKPMARKLAVGGGIGAMVELLRGPSQDARLHVYAALSRLCLLGDATKKFVAEFGLVPMILSQIQLGGTKTLPEALSLLGCICLCKEVEFKKAIISEQALPCLAVLLCSPIALIRQRSLNCIRALTCDDAARVEVVNCGVLEPLRVVATSQEDKHYRKEILGLVAALARCEALHADLDSAGLLELLPRKLRRKSSGLAPPFPANVPDMAAGEGDHADGTAEEKEGGDNGSEVEDEEEEDEVSAAEFVHCGSDDEAEVFSSDEEPPNRATRGKEESAEESSEEGVAPSLDTAASPCATEDVQEFSPQDVTEGDDKSGAQIEIDKSDGRLH